MKITLYGIPKSAVQRLRRLFAGSLGDILWKIVISVVLVGIGYLLLAGGGIWGAIVGGAIITTLIDDDIRAFVSDLWNRRWAKLRG